MTQVTDAKIIVPTESLWVSVNREYWTDSLAELDWNSALMALPDELRPPVSAVKVGSFSDILRRGKICRPLLEFRDFNNQPLMVEKG